MASKLFQTVDTRANHCCEYCKSPAIYSSTPFVLEHIWPLSKSGLTELINLALACQGCNNFKYNFTHALDPVTGIMASLYNPRVENWSDHFYWSNDFKFVLGKTPTGRATVERLKLNRVELLNIRRVLLILDEHPYLL
jgi:HNH endonuclease